MIIIGLIVLIVVILVIKNKYKEHVRIRDHLYPEIERVAEKLINNGLDKYMMKDYKLIGTGLEKNYIKNDEEFCYLSKKKLHSFAFIHYQLEDILKNVLQFLNLPDNNTILNIDYLSRFSEKQQTGQYSRNGYCRIINIGIRQEYSMDNVLAVLFHEVTHFFMDHNHINVNDTYQNERNTDIIACMIGFGKCMESGYKTIEWNYGFLGYGEKHTAKIGYISNKDCHIVRKYVKNYRKKKNQELVNEVNLKNASEELKRQIDTAKLLFCQLKSIDLKTSMNMSLRSKEQIEQLQIALLEYEGRDIAVELEMIEKEIESKNIENIKKATAKAMKLSCDILLWSKVFQGIEN